MTQFAVGDPVIHLPDGDMLTIVSISSPNAVCSFQNGSAANITVPLTSLQYSGPTDGFTTGPYRTLNYRLDNAAVVTPVLQANDGYVEFKNATTTGFTTRSLATAGQRLYVKNSTGTTFNTGDFNVVSTHVWTFIYNGTQWDQIVVA